MVIQVLGQPLQQLNASLVLKWFPSWKLIKELHEVFNPEEDLFVETEDRCIPFRLRNKKVVYLNKE